LAAAAATTADADDDEVAAAAMPAWEDVAPALEATLKTSATRKTPLVIIKPEVTGET